MAKIPTTQRAYTLRLRGKDKNDQFWRDALWATHEVVNKGAKAFGDWLLTLRGGLDHQLADGHPEHRQLLALSWLSVESSPKAGDDYAKYVIKPGAANVLKSLHEILAKRGINSKEIEHWVHDCSPSLTAEIRQDAVWVNRSEAFDDAQERVGRTLTREEAWDMLTPFFASKDAYFESVKTESEEDKPQDGTEEKAKDLVQRAGGWLSRRFGAGKGTNFAKMAVVYEVMAAWAERSPIYNAGASALDSLSKALNEFEPESNDAKGILGLIKGPGYKSASRNIITAWGSESGPIDETDISKFSQATTADAQKSRSSVGGKGRRPWSDALLVEVESACGFAYLQKDGPARHEEYSVMLDHAARRVSIAHTWIKRSEAERRKFSKDAEKIDEVPLAARKWLDEFCRQRTVETGAVDAYRIRKRAIGGWKELVTKWGRANCNSPQDRIDAARELQADPEIDKFGDIQLFEALAADDAVCVWQVSGKPNTQPLIDYVAANDAQAKRQRFKVPAYRHPDPLLHPVFCDFGKSRWDIHFDIHEQFKAANKSKPKKSGEVHPRGLSMALWTGSKLSCEVPLLWACRRLVRDLGLDTNGNGEVLEVTRADRLGRAVKGGDPSAKIKVLGLFEQENWNGRLQAPRKQLDAIARHVGACGWDAKAFKLLNHIRWLVSFSAKLRPQGMWHEYSATFSDDAPAKPFVSGKGEYAVKHQGNEARKGLAKRVLSRLPELRVLSVDLGHRYAAACAVWETLTEKQLKKGIVDREVVAGGTTARDLYVHTQHTDKTGTLRKTIYRRTGPDMWARLDRQFVIKLQGEDKSPRKAGESEILAVEKLESELGYAPSENRSLRIDELMSDAVRTVRLALRCHGDYARIAFKLANASATQDDNAEEFADALLIWHELKTGNKSWASRLWKDCIEAIPEYQEPATLEEGASSSQRRKHRELLRASFKLLAEALSISKLRELSNLWAEQWNENDVKWKDRLKWLRQWLLPKGLGRPRDKNGKRITLSAEGYQKRKLRRGAVRNVGGLSLTRIATIRSLYQVLKAYRMRPEPDDPRKNVPELRDDSLRNFGRQVLDAMEHMREQRVKQLASRIVEAALGIGSEDKGKHWQNGTKRPRCRIAEDRFKPCHAIVIENLTNYRPEEVRTRRENRQLMNWSAAKVKKYLSEGCQLHGIHLRESSPAYTSRQDSRTGEPGIRCEEVTLQEFLRSRHWQDRVRRSTDKNDAESQLLRDVAGNISNKSTLRLPSRSGDLFISVSGRILQADLNAAANIGLRTLIDPDWMGKWWYIPCQSSTGKPVADKVKGSLAVPLDKPLIVSDPASGKKAKTDKDVINLWRDCSSEPLSVGQFKTYAEYWFGVRHRAISKLRKQNGLDT